LKRLAPQGSQSPRFLEPKPRMGCSPPNHLFGPPDARRSSRVFFPHPSAAGQCLSASPCIPDQTGNVETMNRFCLVLDFDRLGSSATLIIRTTFLGSTWTSAARLRSPRDKIPIRSAPNSSTSRCHRGHRFASPRNIRAGASRTQHRHPRHEHL
jgi:hypothetical protein